MQTDAASFDLEIHLQSEKMSDRGGDLDVTSNPVMSHQPAKKATRQWAAWTRQEEESFFTALRLVGKNFEKITCRVQSKNKDQVRHYYYRLIRRMNKLLGPGLCLDSKNSKDTNAAMLRWWSLLEKYSCRASKLHLKPRRCKIFIEALEHQLLRDRKKNGKKQPLQGDNYLLTAPNVVSNQSRGSGLDDRTVKLVLLDSQNISKLSPTKTLLKRNVNAGINRGNNRGDSAVLKPARQRKKPTGIVSPAAYRKWEKAAIAGVSLVADAAEHLERTANTEFRLDQSTSGQKILNSLGLPQFSTTQQNLFVENSISPTKLKLQLFPMDEGTRKALEMDKHNPHLELTLSARKKISSVLEHLNRKWGNSSAACGELKLFPYCVQRENLSCDQMWTQDSIMSAAEVYASIGSPSLFRLRYSWFLYSENGLFTLPVASCCNQSQLIGNRNNIGGQNVDTEAIPVPSTSTQSPDICEGQLNSAKSSLSTSAYHEDSTIHIPNVTHDGNNSAAWIIPKDAKDVDDLRLTNGTSLSAGEWADSLTNVSVGDLLSGVSQEIDTDCIEPPVIETQCLHHIPFSCDSFDVAIQQERMKFQSTLASNIPSIWDAEETCDAFSFRRSSIFSQEVPSTSSFTSSRDCQQITRTNLGGSSHTVKDLPEEEIHVEDQDQIEERESNPQDLENSAKDISGLEDIYWPDSLGPLELDMPSSKYLSENVILSDSLSGLNRLIASSLDAFQNWTFLVSDKKESAPTVEKASLSDFKIGS